MRFVSIVVSLTWLTIFVPSPVRAQNTVPANKSESVVEDPKRTNVQQDNPLQEQPNTLPVDNELGTTGQGEIDSNVTGPRTRDDVIREIFSNHPSGKHRPVPPR